MLILRKINVSVPRFEKPKIILRFRSNEPDFKPNKENLINKLFQFPDGYRNSFVIYYTVRPWRHRQISRCLPQTEFTELPNDSYSDNVNKVHYKVISAFLKIIFEKRLTLKNLIIQ